ncbi:DUF298-domain-containing protein [Neolentinus lepideus HHB14362 ss-1]|uniref:Defective in cullin neddylation protein n=1 Tax=Neolentinus lepideus HHB14362 ss-1 TaxID=1314782 RepID=A0A165NYH2_9AGAM|nr:DUF298-domain-containing protein [Neolentinus lepideus HHB14362 ss-1]
MRLSSIVCCVPNRTIYHSEDEGSRKSKKLPMSVKSSTAKNIKPASSEISDGAPYSAAGALKLFARFADVEEPDVIGPEGLETLCTEAGVPMEGAQPLILAWQLGTKEMAKIRKEEWVKGMEDLRISSLKTLALALQDLEDLLILGKPPMQRFSTPPSKKATKAVPTENDGPYDRDRYFRYTFMKERAFLELYQFCFGLAKTEGSRNIDMETATAFWSVLVVPKYPITAEILDFINAKGTFKGVNKDLWNMTLEFCETVSPNLDNYEADGAWPTMLDEFVTWKKGKNGDEGENKAGEE